MESLNSVDLIQTQKQPLVEIDKGLVNGSYPQEDQVGSLEQVTGTAKKTDGSASFLRAARAGNLEKVLEFLKTNTDINTCNANGLNALHLASKEGHTHVVSALLEREACVDSATKKGNTALHIASLSGQEDIVKVLVEHEASVNIQSQNGFTPLYMAAQEDHDVVVRFLLAHGANQSLATEEGFTPLAVALQQGHNKVVSVLLENDTRGKVRLPALHIAAKKDDAKAAALLLLTDHNPDVTSKSGFTPLHIASHYGNQNIAALLIQRGADVNYVAKHQINPLHVASKWGKGNMVSLLLERGANIEAKTRDGLTPLHCSARSGHETVVDMLLEKGAPITSKTKNGLAPLHMASQGDHVDAARILLYHKAPVDDVTVDFLTALHVAAHCGHVRVAKLLLDRKADPNSRALNGFTPLHIACKKNRIKVVELLLKHGASIEATTESGLTPLHVASFMGCMNIVIYLIQHGCSVDVPTVRGETPLHLAARANQTDIIRILLRNGAHVDARAREQQSALHIASRLGNADIAVLLLQHGANVDVTTKDHYTPLHISCKEGQEEVCTVLLDHGASNSEVTKKGFTPLHLASKYGQLKVVKLLLQRDAPVDAQGKNNVTPLHVAAHYDHQNVAMLLLDKGASPHATAKNGYTPLHIAARKNQMDIAATLLEYGARSDAESRAGFTPLHLASQEGHTEMTSLLIEHKTDVGAHARNGLTPLHLAAQEDKVGVAAILIKNGAEIDPETKAGYTPLHVACHFGQMNMVRFLLQHGAIVDVTTQLGYTPLHQASQQGHTQIINLLLENKAEPNMETKEGKTALSIAQRLGYISVVETLKVVTETKVTTNTTTITEEKYKVVVPETMHETFLSESEDEGGDDTMLGDQSYRFLTVDEMKSLGDDSLPIDDRMDVSFQSTYMSAPLHPTGDHSPQNIRDYSYPLDNVDVSRAPVLAGSEECLLDDDKIPLDASYDSILSFTSSNSLFKRFLVSFMVDARGGAMRGCRHSGVRVIIPPRKAAMPMRITCRYLKKDKLVHAPPLMEGEALSSRILEMGPSTAKFLGPVIIEVPHFASLRGKEREIVILRSDNGETWKEHTLEATEEAVQDVLNESFDGEELKQLEDLNTNRITRILTTDFPQYFAIVTRIRQEVHAIGPEGGMVSSTVVPQVQAVFPHGALTKKIKVGLQAQPISPELVAKLLGNRVAVSPIVTVEPRRRKFHKPITLTIPVPQAASKGMINQYSGETPTLRLLCSITGGTSRAVWEDVTGSTPLTLVNDCVSFTTTVSARFWLMDCTNIPEATKMATELYREAIHVPFMSKFMVFSKRHQLEEARVRVFCMTDDKEDKTLETQEQFIEVAKSRDVEVLEGKPQYLEFGGNIVPVTKSGEQLAFNFYAFRENRLPFTVRVKDINAEPVGRVAFMRQAKVGRGDPPQNPICNLNLSLPENVQPELAPSEPDLLSLERKYAFLSISKADTIHKADLRLSDIANMLSDDWLPLAKELELNESDINIIRSQYPENPAQQAIVMLRLWMQTAENKATGNILEKSLRNIDRNDIVDKCIFNVELVTDDLEKAVAKTQLDQSGFEALTDELGPSRDINIIKDESMYVSYDEKDIMKEAESADEDDIKKIQSDIHKGGDISPTYEREEKKYAGEEKSYSIEEKTVHEQHTNKFDEETNIEKKHQRETIFPEEDKHVQEESQLKQTDKLSKEDTVTHENKIIIETQTKEGQRTEVTTEKIDDLIQQHEEKSHEQKFEKNLIEDLPGYTIKTSEKNYEKSEFKSSQENRHSQERTLVEVDTRPSDFAKEVSEVMTAEKKHSPVDISIPPQQMPKDQMLEKLGEELGRLDDKLQEKFKSKLATGKDEEGLDEIEDEIITEQRISTSHITSQVIVEPIMAPDLSTEDDAIYRELIKFGSHEDVHQQVEENFTQYFQNNYAHSDDIVIENKNFKLSDADINLDAKPAEDIMLIKQLEVSDEDDRVRSETSSDSGQDTRDSQEFELIVDSLKHGDTVISNDFIIDESFGRNVGRIEEEPMIEEFEESEHDSKIYEVDQSFKEDVTTRKEPSHGTSACQKFDVDDDLRQALEKELFDSSDHQSMEYMQPQLSEDFEPKQELTPGVEESSNLVHSSEEYADELNDDDSQDDHPSSVKRESLGEMEPQISEDFQPEAVLQSDSISKQDISELTSESQSTDARKDITDECKQIEHSGTLSREISSISEKEDDRDSVDDHRMEHDGTIQHGSEAEPQDWSTQLSGSNQTGEIITPQTRDRGLPDVQPVKDVSIENQTISQVAETKQYSQSGGEPLDDKEKDIKHKLSQSSLSSSYENIYDNADLRTVIVEDVPTTELLKTKLGDPFCTKTLLANELDNKVPFFQCAYLEAADTIANDIIEGVLKISFYRYQKSGGKFE